VWQAVRDDPDVRVMILKGAGDRAFSAGADVTEFGSAPSYVDARRARRERDLWPLLLHLPKPTIAALHGYALGGGLELSLYCDFRIAAESARLGLPEVGLGYIPSAGGTQMLPRTIRFGPALEMVLSGDPIDARQALRLGLVHRVVPEAALYPEAERLARRLAERSPVALAAAKRAVNAALDLAGEGALLVERRLAQRILREQRSSLSAVLVRSDEP
jgi:enoyl-CoA hydratase/carnithine racemase